MFASAVGVSSVAAARPQRLRPRRPARCEFPARESSDFFGAKNFAPRPAGPKGRLVALRLDHSGIYRRHRTTERPNHTRRSAIGFGVVETFA
jgi:hypothetical protein